MLGLLQDPREELMTDSPYGLLSRRQQLAQQMTHQMPGGQGYRIPQLWQDMRDPMVEAGLTSLGAAAGGLVGLPLGPAGAIGGGALGGGAGYTLAKRLQGGQWSPTEAVGSMLGGPEGPAAHAIAPLGVAIGSIARKGATAPETAGLLTRTLGRHVKLDETPLGLLEVAQEYPRNLQKRWPLLEEAGELGVPTAYRASKYEGLSDDGVKFIKQFKLDDYRNKTAIHYNEKTGLSVDFSTSCPKRMAGGCGSGACAYCYVEHDRSARKAGLGTPTRPKNLVENDYEDELLRMPTDLITNLNRDGGLRMFSFGDFRPDIDDANVAKVLEDASKRGLYVKAITKEPELIRRFGDHPNFRANLSVDYLPREASNSFTVEDAIALKAGRPNIKIRSVALNMEEAERMAADPRIDVITLYHGPTGDRLFKIIKEQNPKLIEKFGGEANLAQELERWENMSPRSKNVQEFMARNKGRVCCQGGKCATDPSTKCGFATAAVGTLLPGVFVKEWLSEKEDEGDF